MPVNNLCLYLDLVIGCIQVSLQGSDLVFQLLYHSWKTHKTMCGMEMKQTQYKAITLQKLFLCFCRKSQLNRLGCFCCGSFQPIDSIFDNMEMRLTNQLNLCPELSTPYLICHRHAKGKTLAIVLWIHFLKQNSLYFKENANHITHHSKLFTHHAIWYYHSLTLCYGLCSLHGGPLQKVKIIVTCVSCSSMHGKHAISIDIKSYPSLYSCPLE